MRKASAPRPIIHESMNVMEAIALHPKAADVLAAYGLHCFQCAFNTMDSISGGARTHGLTDTDIENIIVDLQELIDSTPLHPAVITLTPAAAEALLLIGKQEGKKEVSLRVAMEPQGGFCMEFDDTVHADDAVFTCPGIKRVQVTASPQALWRMGGSTIDFREGRFKLDMDETCACGSSSCGCGESGIKN